MRPGDVQQARNYACKHCMGVFRTPQGLMGHLSKIHHIKPQRARYKKDWYLTQQLARNAQLKKLRP